MANAQQTLCIATRKGLFSAVCGDVGWRIGTPHFPGEPVTQFAAEPDGGSSGRSAARMVCACALRSAADTG